MPGSILYITNHFTHPLFEAQEASPRWHLARKIAEKGVPVILYSPLGTRTGSPLRDFVSNLRPRRRTSGKLTLLFPPLIAAPGSVGTALALAFGTLFIVVYVALMRGKVRAQYATTMLVASVGAVVHEFLGIPLVANYGDPDFAREKGYGLRGLRFCENVVMARKNADSVVYVDEVVGRYVRQNFGVSRLFFLPNGGYERGTGPVSPDDPDASKLRTGLKLDGKSVVMYAGQVTSTYRLDLLVDASLGVIARVPDAAFVVIGGGSALPGLRRAIDDKGVGPFFRVLGPVRYADLGRYLAVADVGVQLLGDMCMGTKVLMYMANRKAVVSAGAWWDRYSEFLRNGENAVLIPPNVDALSLALTSLLEDDARRERIAESGFRTAGRYSWDDHAERTLELLEEARRRASGPGAPFAIS